MTKKFLDMSWADVNERATEMAHHINSLHRRGLTRIRTWGVPNGGVYAAIAARAELPKLELVEDPRAADVFVDDLVDSGETRRKLEERFPMTPFFALCDKQTEGIRQWVRFPWERMGPQRSDGIEDNIVRILQFIGEDTTREGLKDTPQRVAKSYKTLFSGYNQSAADVLTVFEADKYDEMVVLKNIEFSSTCEHHMLPFYGRAHIAYVPDKKVIGISKLARVLEIFSRRLQVQERICSQVTEALMEHLKPLGAACVLEGRHFCMICRGVEKQNSVMVTSSLLGVFREPSVRAELFGILSKEASH